EQGGGMSTWLTMGSYPATLCYYAACLGAETAGNFGLVRKLFGHDLRLRGHRQSALPNLCAWFANDGNVAEGLHKSARHTPMSDHLATVFAPLLKGSPADPGRTYDRLEILMALAQIDRADDPMTDTYLPWGRFAWKHQ